jgi:flagellar hook assembly protein FlgD
MVRTGRAHISILDPMGREIATVLSAQKPQGDQSVTWNGQSRDGRAVPAGLYFVRLESEGVATRAHKLVRVR